MIVIDKNFYPKATALKRCEDFMKTSTVFFADGSFTSGKKKGGYGFISLGKMNAKESAQPRQTLLLKWNYRQSNTLWYTLILIRTKWTTQRL